MGGPQGLENCPKLCPNISVKYLLLAKNTDTQSYTVQKIDFGGPWGAPLNYIEISVC